MPPGWDGVETTARIWEVDPGLQVVICTAYSDYDWVDLANKLGRTDRLLILKKPFDSIEARQMACALTEKWKLARQASWKLEKLEGMVRERTVELRREIAEHKQAEEEKSKLEERLRQGQKMEAIGTLASGIAHDFNNLLTGILGYSSMLKLLAQPGDDVLEAAEAIGRAATRAAEFTKQILGFARRGKLQNTPVDVHHVIGDVAGILGRTIDKKIGIALSLHAESPVVTGDPSQLQQVVMNLAVNARDAMPTGGEIIFATEAVDLDEEYCRDHPHASPGRYLLVSVTDTGTGIPEEVRHRVFEPFFTTKGPGEGTGMGLAMAYGIVKNHDGFIEVYSEVGRGTTVKVYLPLCGEAIARDEGPRLAAPIPGGGRILVVDDEEVVREVVERMLGCLGYEVACVHNGREAADHYGKHGPDIDLVILDMTMPVMDGGECFRALKGLDPEVKALLSTGHALNGTAQRLLDEGMLGFVQKPYVLAQLSEAVARALGRG